jgi:hypothetical protein
MVTAALVHANGTITLAVYRKSGIAGANARLAQLGDDHVVVVPVEAGCPDPDPDSLLPPSVSPKSFAVVVDGSESGDGSVTVNAQGIPAGDILVVGIQTRSGSVTGIFGAVTSAPPPSCLSRPGAPSGTGSSGS